MQYADMQEPYEKIWMSISGDLVRSLLVNYRFTEEINVVTVDTHRTFIELHKAVVDNRGLRHFLFCSISCFCRCTAIPRSARRRIRLRRRFGSI